MDLMICDMFVASHSGLPVFIRRRI